MLHFSELYKPLTLRKLPNEINAMDAKQIKLSSIGWRRNTSLNRLYGLYGGIFAIEIITLLSFVFHVGNRIVTRKGTKQTHER